MNKKKKRYLLRLLSPLVAIPTIYAVRFVSPRVSYETYQLFLLLLVLLGLLVGLVLYKYERALGDSEIDKKAQNKKC